VSGYERVGQSTPKYMATGERQSVGFPVDSGLSQPDITPFHFLTIDLYESKHQSETYNLTMMMYHHRLQLLHVQYVSL
jgi:hypothetical protein